ncbi:hypothetical protein LCGC14_1109840 [marine sediment metagenome]|uniref:Uncharacterized protein n=1 Tax=marine sediment metagenome TaxID=412755 RepID=A0A0F9M705_9ZZZZ
MSVLEAVAAERERQDEKWGGLEHDDQHNSHDWLAYIVRYLGRSVAYGPFDSLRFRRHMVQVAALAVAAAEWADRLIDDGR